MTATDMMIDLVRYAHIFVVAIGFGAAFMADFQVISRLRQPVDDALLSSLEFYHAAIWKMLFGMWVTGLILIAIRTQFVPANFSPKLICKLATVAILTANAGVIGKIALPLIRDMRGRSLLWLPVGPRLCLAGIGAMSSASWMLALAMGSSKVLAASGWIVFVALVPLVYFSSVIVAIGVIYLLHRGSSPTVLRLPTYRSGARSVERWGAAPIPVPAPIPANRRTGTVVAAE